MMTGGLVAHGLSLFRSSILTLTLGYWTFGFASALYVGNQVRRRHYSLFRSGS